MGRLISVRMSYKNHYMCSGEATSYIKVVSFEVVTNLADIYVTKKRIYISFIKH